LDGGHPLLLNKMWDLVDAVERLVAVEARLREESSPMPHPCHCQPWRCAPVMLAEVGLFETIYWWALQDQEALQKGITNTTSITGQDSTKHNHHQIATTMC